MKTWIRIAAIITLTTGCASKADKPSYATAATGGDATYSTDTGGRKSTGGRSGTQVGGGSATGGSATTNGGTNAGGASNVAGNGGIAGAVNLGPTVKITNPPTSLQTPDESGVIVVSSFDALCTVQQSTAPGASAVSSSSVKIELLDASNKVITNQPSVPASPTGNTGEYKATFTFSSTSVTAGRITFRCTASDQSTPAHSNSDTVATYVDYGPDIKYISPAKDSAGFPLNAVVPFEIEVDPHLLDSVDSSASVTNVALQVYTATISTTVNGQGHYVAQVDFTDQSKFPQGLSGTISASVTATNNRKPKAATSTMPINLILDGTPPVIQMIDPTPAANSIIGGARKICFNVSDPNGSGVNQSTVTVMLDTTAYVYLQPLPTLWTSPAVGSYCFQFNSTDFPNSKSQVTVAILATDNAGNVATKLTRQFYLDNIPPFISLDPPNIRVVTHPNSSTTNCSIPFDPVGPAAANTGSVQAHSGLVRFRAFVWDRTNSLPDQAVVWYSGVDDSKVHIYLRPVPDSSTLAPVEIDADQDPLNLCDSVDPDLKTGTASTQTQLKALTSPNGSPDYSVAEYATPPDVSLLGCQTSGSAPDPLCGQKTSDLTFVTTMNFASTTLDLSAVYAVNTDSSTSSLLCTGDQWDIHSAGGIPDGWVCVVAEAVDFAGNIGISAPLPICLDHTNGGTVANAGAPPACAITSSVPPNCALGCVPPSRGLLGDDASGNPIPFPIVYK
jgi:hypothetical protein